MISAIPTNYNGIKYRSRTEARWAVFLDKARIQFRYEPEGYQTDGGLYLPDFELAEATRRTFFEVKPGRPTTEEIDRMSGLAQGAEAHVFVALGAPVAGCVIWKVYSDGSHKQWYFARDKGFLVSFLVDLQSDQGLPIRAGADVSQIHSSGAATELTFAQQYQFPLFGGGRPKMHGVRDRRDWREREREILNARTAEMRERRGRS